MLLFCFEQKTTYELRISDWSSDVCSSDLEPVPDTKTSHSGISHQIGRERSCAGLSQKGLAAAIFQRDRVNRLTTPGYAEKQRFAPGREQPRGVASRAAGNAPAPWHENGEPLPAIQGSAGDRKSTSQNSSH